MWWILYDRELYKTLGESNRKNSVLKFLQWAEEERKGQCSKKMEAQGK